MNQFQVSPLKRLISRIYFYSTLMIGALVIGNMIPSASDLQAERDRRLGVSKAYYGVSPEEIPEEYR